VYSFPRVARKTVHNWKRTYDSAEGSMRYLRTS